MTGLSYLAEELQHLDEVGLLRSPRGSPPPAALLARSNDYLGYASGADRVGAGGSRLVVGDSSEHTALESACASWLCRPAALAYSSGYAANVGLVSSLAGEGDVVVSLRPNHASIVDSCRLSRARVEVVEWDALTDVRAAFRGRARRRFLVCESYYSMDGVSPDLRGLRATCDEFDAVLLVDEAHALGVFGVQGRGLCEESGVGADALVGTFGKALGGQGAFICGPAVLRQWLWNRSRSFVYSTGMSPRLCAQMVERIGRVRADDQGRRRLAELVAWFRGELGRRGVPVVAHSFGPIVPVLAGTSSRAVAWERALLREGILVPAIRPPTVPEGSARLRVTVSVRHSRSELARIAEVLGSCL